MTYESVWGHLGHAEEYTAAPRCLDSAEGVRLQLVTATPLRWLLVFKTDASLGNLGWEGSIPLLSCHFSQALAA